MGEPHSKVSAPFNLAHQRLDWTLRTLAKLQAIGASKDLSPHDMCDSIDEQLCIEAWQMVSYQASTLADLAVKARYVQQFLQVDGTDLESQLSHSLCRDVLAMVALILGENN